MTAASVPEAGRRPSRIAIWGHYHGGNQGDDIVVDTLIRNIRARLPDAEVVGVCQSPADTRLRHGIEAVPLTRAALGSRPRPGLAAEPPAPPPPAAPPPRVARVLRAVPGLGPAARVARERLRAAADPLGEPAFLARSYAGLRGVDLVVVAGSNPLFDGWTGAWSHPYTLLKWALLAGAAGARFACLSAGAGPIETALGRRFVRGALRRAEYASYRDPGSARLIASLGVPGPARVVPDLAFGLTADELDAPPLDLPPGPPVVGLNPMAHADPRYWPRGDPPRYRAYVRKLADFAAWLLRGGRRVLLFSSQLGADPRVFDDLCEHLKRETELPLGERLIQRPIHTRHDLLGQLAACDCVVASRYHSVLLPQLMGKPVLALAYAPKTRELMDWTGQAELCVDADAFATDELIARFERMVRESDAVRARLAERVPGCREAVRAQYDAVFGSPIA